MEINTIEPMAYQANQYTTNLSHGQKKRSFLGKVGRVVTAPARYVYHHPGKSLLYASGLGLLYTGYMVLDIRHQINKEAELINKPK